MTPKPISLTMETREVQILRALLQVSPGYLSGQQLAGQFAVSRVAIWHTIRKLQSFGLPIEGVRKVGYRYNGRVFELQPHLMMAAVNPNLFAACQLHFHTTIGSTNNEASELHAAHSPAPFVVVAKEQTRGRGRFGRTWESPDASNLYASFGYRPRIPPSRMGCFTLWLGLNLAEILCRKTGLDIRLKWPNDLLSGGKKCAGMLTEARMDQDEVREVIFGLGLNINSAPGGEISAHATSLAAETGQHLPSSEIAGLILSQVHFACDEFFRAGLPSSFWERWEQYDYLKGREVVVNQGGNSIRGTALGIDVHGSLLLSEKSGARHSFRSGEVTLGK